jgi:hypothetical protein
MKPQPIKLETRVLLKPSKYALFKYGWKYTEIVMRRPFWYQDLDKDGNPIHTGRIGVHQENLFEISALVVTLGLAAELMYILITFPYPTF